MDKPVPTVDLPETARLPDGATIQIRHVLPDDRGLFLAAWERLSPETRYRRFLGPKTELSEVELDFYTQVDGHDHIAIGALLLGEGGEPTEGIAVARIVRSSVEPYVGELGIVVVDDWQGKGVGGAVMLRLLKMAQAEDIRRVRAYAWSGNESIERLLRRYPYDVLTRHASGEMRVELDLMAGHGTADDRSDS